MRFAADFVLSAWIQNMIIEAESEEDARKQLGRLTLDELQEHLNYDTDIFVKDVTVNDDDVDLAKVDSTLVVKVHDIVYKDEDGNAFTPDNINSSYEITMSEVTDDEPLEDLISWQLSLETGVDMDEISYFKYDIIKEY